MSCPIHQGDNPNGCCIFLNNNSVYNWKCWTSECEKIYGRSIISFIKALLSKKQNVTYNYTEEWIKSFIANNKEPILQKELVFSHTPISKLETLNRIQFRSKLAIPAKYYLERGFSKDTLNKFDVGLCLDKKNSFYMRIVIPVYDELGYNVIGQISRSQNGKCDKCNYYHFPNRDCPSNSLEQYWASKWLNSKGFPKSTMLYNIWNAGNFIKKTGTAIIVEGQGDVWKLNEAGIYNCVGLFGRDLSRTQTSLLKKYGATKIVPLMDNDNAGIQAKEKIIKNTQNQFEILDILYNGKDIGELDIAYINEKIKPFIGDLK